LFAIHYAKHLQCFHCQIFQLLAIFYARLLHTVIFHSETFQTLCSPLGSIILAVLMATEQFC
jgi:hypothetical protein